MKQFIESLKRLYSNQEISKDKIIEMYKKKTISEDEMDYILN